MELKGKNILVTGGAGFVGSHLTEILVKKGASVVVLQRSCNPHSYFFRSKLDQKTILVTCDLKDRRRVFEVVSKYEIDYIFHLGALAIVPTAFLNPVETIETNVLGTTYILEAARHNPSIKGVIVASSDKAYGKNRKQYLETSPLNGDHPYDVSKSCTDLIARAYFKTYNVPVVIARFGNIYGEGDLNFSRIIPGIMKSLITKKTLLIRSDGKHIRDLVYVKDVALGYLFLLENLEKIKGEAFNICSLTNCSVLELIKKTEKVLKKKIPYKILNTAKNEIPYQHLDDTKIRKLGWKSKYTLDNTLPKLFLWYKKLLTK